MEVINSLPDDVTLEDMVEELEIIVASRRGPAAIYAGRTKTHDNVKQMVESWAESWANS